MLLLRYVGEHSLWCCGAGGRLGMGKEEVAGKEQDAFSDPGYTRVEAPR